MKTLFTHFFGAAMLLMHLFASAQPERICVSQTDSTVSEDCSNARGTSPFVTGSDNRVHFRVKYLYSNEDNTSTLRDSGWYKAFWIFGDGNFAYFPTDFNAREQDIKTLIFNNYVYARRGQFPVAVYLTEKYSNTTKPPDTRIIIETPNDVTTGFTPQLWQLSGGKRFDLLPNHQPRMEHKLVFAVSWKKYLDARKLVFFFNGYKNTSGTVQAHNAIIPLEKVEHEIPYYFNITSEDRPFVKRGSTTNEYSDMSSQYANYIEYDLSLLDNSKVPHHFDEIRVFPVLEINDLRHNDTLKAAMLSFEAQLWGFDSITPNNQKKSSIQNTQLLERATYQQQVLTSHDPNDLNVLKIENLGGNRFRVHFKLMVCNDGAIPETSIQLFVKSLLPTAQFYALKIIDPEIEPYFDAVSGRWEAKFPDVYIPPAPHPAYSPSCKDFVFTMETDSVGLTSLYNTQFHERPIEACVKFMSSTSPEECNRNNPIPTTFKIEKCQWDYLLWIIFVGLGLLGLLALAVAWVQRSRRMNP